MRKLMTVALAGALAVALVACGGDDDDSADATTTTTASADDGGTTTDDGGGDGGVTDAAGLLGEDCAFLLSGAFLNPLGAAVPGADADLEAGSEQLEAIADAAPDEIKDAMATIAEGYAAMAELLEDVDLQDPQSFNDPELQAALAELEDSFDEEYEAAGQAVSDYVAENCSGS